MWFSIFSSPIEFRPCAFYCRRSLSLYYHWLVLFTGFIVKQISGIATLFFLLYRIHLITLQLIEINNFDFTAVDWNAGEKTRHHCTLRRNHLQAEHGTSRSNTPEHHFQSTKFRGTSSLSFICPKNVRSLLVCLLYFNQKTIECFLSRLSWNFDLSLYDPLNGIKSISVFHTRWHISVSFYFLFSFTSLSLCVSNSKFPICLPVLLICFAKKTG